MDYLITNDAVTFGILACILAFVFVTASSAKVGWQKFYGVIPSVLLCYFLPSLLNTFHIVDVENSKLYSIASKYLLPACLVLLTISIDFPAIMRLGKKAIVMFLAGTFGIVIGGPLAVIIFSYINPEIVGGVGPDSVWRGLSTIAGSWIGGSANQTAMKEVFQPSDSLFSAMITVDVIVGNLWTAFLLLGAGKVVAIDKWLKADSKPIEEVKHKIIAYQESIVRIPKTADIIVILAIGFGVTGLSHFGADLIVPYLESNYPQLAQISLTSSFFWIVVLATTGGLLLSFTKAKEYEGAGASKLGSVMLYFLIATIGMKMNVLAIFDSPGLFLVGLLWIFIHVSIMFIVAKIIKAPFFFVAVGSQANVGGAASAPVVASAFHPSLASVGVLLAVLGYALGTYGGYISTIMMQSVAP